MNFFQIQAAITIPKSWICPVVPSLSLLRTFFFLAFFCFGSLPTSNLPSTMPYLDIWSPLCHQSSSQCLFSYLHLIAFLTCFRYKHKAMGNTYNNPMFLLKWVIFWTSPRTVYSHQVFWPAFVRDYAWIFFASFKRVSRWNHGWLRSPLNLVLYSHDLDDYYYSRITITNERWWNLLPGPKNSNWKLFVANGCWSYLIYPLFYELIQ